MQEHRKGSFVNFILLRKPEWDSAGFFKRLKGNWDIAPEGDVQSKDERIFVFLYHNITISAAFMPAPVPNGEAEDNARFNYLWHGAAEETAKHTAQIIVSAAGGNGDPLENAETLIKVCESCVDENTIGVYANGIVYQPEFYAKVAQDMKQGELPIFDLVWFGLTNLGNGALNGYTMGLENFGKREIEVLECTDAPSRLLDFMINMTSYVLAEDVTLHDGETIGFSAEQKLKITLSDGVEFDFKTLKIEYPEKQ